MPGRARGSRPPVMNGVYGKRHEGSEIRRRPSRTESKTRRSLDENIDLPVYGSHTASTCPTARGKPVCWRQAVFKPRLYQRGARCNCTAKRSNLDRATEYYHNLSNRGLA